jgi:S1-C subfamily serine protease
VRTLSCPVNPASTNRELSDRLTGLTAHFSDENLADHPMLLKSRRANDAVMANPMLDPLRSLDQALSGAVATVAPGVVHVARGRAGGGTGIVWAADLVISSSFHTPDQTRVGLPTSDGELDHRNAEVIGRDAGTDLAVLRVAGAGLTLPTYRELDDLAVGNLALAIGRPGRSVRASLRAVGVLGGEVRTPHGGRLERYVESDRQLPRGFAGGPLIDAAGAVIGMNTRTLLRGRDLAIPTVTLHRVVAELVAHGAIRRGYLGVGAYPAQLAADGRGALVAGLDDGGPGASAGLLVGDVILELRDGAAEPITGPDELRAALADRAGRAVTLGLLRAGARLDLAVTIGTRP